MRSFSTSLLLVSFAVVAASCGSNPPGVTPDGSGGSVGGSGGSSGGAVAGGGGTVAGSGGAVPGGRGGSGSGGTPVVVTDPAAQAKSIAELRATIAADKPADAAGFAARWPTKYMSGLPYDPLSAAGFDKIAASRLGVSAAERTALARDGFVVSARQTFPTFYYGYKAIYADHLPLYVSADSVMYAVHRSYDAALKELELGFMVPNLTSLLAAMHAELGAGGGGDLPADVDVRADVDVYLTVARRLLGNTSVAPVTGTNTGLINQLVSAAMAATDGVSPVSLFGETRYVDFSQFKPRGHYADDSRLQTYFRAMIWLGRTDFRFLQYDTSAPSAPPRFSRRQFLDGLLLAALTDGNDRLTTWRQIDDVLRAFVGESDNMTVADFPKLRDVTGAATAAALAALPDQTLAQALLDGGFGIQRIASQILFVPPGGAGAPLDRVFLFFGQRFVIDSEVFSNVVFDRVRGDPKRMLPNPLDVAFAALRNNAAAPLLASELQKYPNYPGALHEARRLVDSHGGDFWGGSLYGAWLGALRGLSVPEGDPTSAAGLPTVMKTEPWARRMLNTQLASWAELRHDTLLYAKQSYTAFPVCEFPDAYVDPYPEAWAGIVALARLGQTVAMALPTGAGNGAGLGAYFAEVETIAGTLGAMAQAERDGQPMTAEQLAFINQAVEEVNMSVGCATIPWPKGWYVRLFMDDFDATKTDPTIADVHTNPADAQVLHVATGLPRLMYVTVDSCNGPRAYAGLVSSYFEKTTGNFQRLTDMEWSAQVMSSTPPPDVGWMSSLVAR